jgi:serine/threonine protein kinase
MGPSGVLAPPTPAELAPHLPDLELLALIGQGGMGAVYRVRRRSDGNLFALKVVRPVPGQDATFAARFAREAEALKRLHHPHIVAIHGHGTSGPWCWLLMDLIDGANLREIVATGRLSPTQTLALVPPLCVALQYAHDQGVIHRDLKPENILLDAAGVPHLVDFGLAKLCDSASGSGLTNSGAAMGTVHYMAPEGWIKDTRILTHHICAL